MADNLKYDVAITGGGLAGLCLAIQCAKHNYSVVLFEKEEYPFHKVCGEYISLESWNFLQSLGVPISQMQLPLIKSLKLTDGAGRSYSFQLPLGGFGISRYLLDNSLYNLALSYGVTINTNTKVDNITKEDSNFIVTSNGPTISAKVAAGCFGKRSNIDVKWQRPFIKEKPNPLNNYIGIKYHIKYAHPEDEIVLHNFYNGYCGMSKIEEDKSCLCYLTTAENLRSAGNSIEEMEKRVLFKNPQLRRIFNEATFLYNQPLAISQVSFSKKKQVENGVLMLGDAAGMISPLCGNGMSMAMHASKIAFQSIDSFLTGQISKEEMEEKYIKSWQKEFSKRLWLGRNVQRMFGGNLTTSLFLKSMQLLSPLAEMLIKSTHGEPF